MKCVILNYQLITVFNNVVVNSIYLTTRKLKIDIHSLHNNQLKMSRRLKMFLVTYKYIVDTNIGRTVNMNIYSYKFYSHFFVSFNMKDKINLLEF